MLGVLDGTAGPPSALRSALSASTIAQHSLTPSFATRADPPLRAIGLALLLLCFGTVLLTLGALSLDGRYHMPEKGSFRQMARPVSTDSMPAIHLIWSPLLTAS